MNSDLLQKVLDWLAQTANFVATNGWRITMKQVYFMGLQRLFWFAILVVMFFVALHFIKALKKWEEDSDDYAYTAFAIFLLVLEGLGAAALLISALNYLINPEWMAIQLILSQVK